jgi:hypothetical protein
MTRTKKILLVASGIGIIAIACMISWSIGFRQGMRGGGLIGSLSELMLLNHHVEDQMTNGTCEGVKQAIEDYLKILDKYRNVKDSFVSDTAYDGERMVAHIRLGG